MPDVLTDTALALVAAGLDAERVRRVIHPGGGGAAACYMWTY
jgi:hypothetical protein